MALLRFRVVSLADEPNVQGRPMVRVHLVAHEGDAFKWDGELPKELEPCPPDGHISMLVNEEYVRTRKLRRGALVDPNLNLLEE